jgi:hypothetical protein
VQQQRAQGDQQVGGGGPHQRRQSGGLEELVELRTRIASLSWDREQLHKRLAEAESKERQAKVEVRQQWSRV